MFFTANLLAFQITPGTLTPASDTATTAAIATKCIPAPHDILRVGVAVVLAVGFAVGS